MGRTGLWFSTVNLCLKDATRLGFFPLFPCPAPPPLVFPSHLLTQAGPATPWRTGLACFDVGAKLTGTLLFALQFVKTILSQGHLTPLPLNVSPVYWAYDYTLRTYPLPDMIVFADKYDPFTVTNMDCLCINPVRALLMLWFP